MSLNSVLSLSILACFCSSLSIAQVSDNVAGDNRLAANYQYGAVESMLDEGRALMEQGQYSDAERSFFEALQVVKINNGITSNLQIPVLELLIKSQLPQRKWETIQQYLSYFDWLNGELYRENVVDFLSGTEVLGSLYLQASADEANPRGGHYLIASKNLYWNAISAIEGIYGRQSKLLTPWLYRVVLSHFYQSSLVMRRGLTSYDYKTDKPAIINGWSLSKNESIAKSYNIGLELLQRIRDIVSVGGNQEAEAIAWLYLGDWETVFDNGASAISNYQKANQLFLENGADQATIDTLFSQTAILPEANFESELADLMATPIDSDTSIEFIAWSANFPGAAVPAALKRPFTTNAYPIRARISFNYNLGSFTELMGNKTVTRSLFSKSNVTLISISQESEEARAQALRDVSFLHLRPQLKSGELVSSEGITVDYMLSRQTAQLLLSDN